MQGFAIILVGTILVNNFELVQFLGLRPFMGVSNKLESAIGMTGATTFVLTLAAISGYLVSRLVLIPLGLESLRTIAFAQAIANDDAINKSPQGGQSTINDLANPLIMQAPTFDEEHGEESDRRYVAFIREAECIGCTRCIQACPVDAILGAAQHMHTVLASECTGCDLCVDPCPVDCIEMVPIRQGFGDWNWPPPLSTADLLRSKQHPNLITKDRVLSDHARQRFEQRKLRLEQMEAEEEAQRRARQQKAKVQSSGRNEESGQDLIAAAQARVQANKASPEEQRSRLERSVASAESRVETARQRLASEEEAEPAKREALQARLEEAERRLKDARLKLAEAERSVAHGESRPTAIEDARSGEN